jgi:hypothetical protein
MKREEIIEPIRAHASKHGVVWLGERKDRKDGGP